MALAPGYAMSDAKDNGTTLIYIVDDAAVNIRLLSGMLEDEGFRTRAFQNGADAVRDAVRDGPDLVLLDVIMPDMDGYETCRRFKADPALREIPILFLSSLENAADKVKAFQAGGVDFLSKPFQFDELHVRIETHLRLRRLQAELERKNRELQKGYDRLRELETLRDNLMHMIVHDMRQPLTGLFGYLQLLKMRARDAALADMAGYVDRCMESSTALIEMVNSLLEIHRMESGVLELKKSTYSLSALADRAWDRMESLRGTRTLSRRYPAEPLTVLCDEELILRVLQNILGNALGFAPEGSTIGIEIEGVGQLAVVRIHDDGPGIAPEHHARIFEKFGQVKATDVPRAHSTGLGLAFCKLAVEAHGGTIGVESDVDKGSTFWFMIPRA